MSVIKNLRTLSRLEYYHLAVKIRNSISDWLMRDFGIKRNARSVKQVIKNISSEDQEIIDKIFQKYGRGIHNQYQSEYPLWKINFEKTTLEKITQALIFNIIKAETEKNKNKRREYQNKAIDDCYCLYQELQHISEIFIINMNSFIIILENIENEISYLESWRDQTL